MPKDNAKKKEKTLGITVKKHENFAEWYPEVVVKAELADYSPIKGCMIIRPNAYAVWEKIQQTFNAAIKKHGVKNAYFPLFIPESFFKKEAKHAEGFTPEVAWIGNKSEDEERVAVRPTSETIIADSFKNWVRSWRDLPLKVNQWCNIVRWETNQTRLFLRTREFLWQEGHCIYETEEQCEKDTHIFLNEYVELVKNVLALPVIPGRKTEKEKFAGAKHTYTTEALMPDGRALQIATSHNLGQGFMTVFGVKFIGKDEQESTPWYNSWGISTRTIGAAIMTHGDDKGMVMPPRVAPIQAVIVPIIFEDSKAQVLEAAQKIKRDLELHGIDVHLDDRDEYSPGWKFNEWELKGVPLRIELGPKDLAQHQCVVARRDNGTKTMVPLANVKDKVKDTLEQMHHDMFNKAKKFLESNVTEAHAMDALVKGIKDRKMVLVPFCGGAGCEDYIKEKTEGATSRCIPFDRKLKPGSKCVECGKEAKDLVYFAKAY
ncbi:MAG TPA: proline--tRNA ligase [Candidatus Binatia bacterium]|nr:proline--tRNA ligase [Candidatus Binatia bacterium]